MNLFKIESPFRRSKKSQDPTEKTRAIAERLYRNRKLTKRFGDADSDWTKAERILKSPVRRVLFRLNQPLIRAEKGAVEPVANWVDRADLFRIIERLSPTLEALGVIAIPLVLFFAAQGYQESLRQQELERLQQQAVTDYLNQLSAILLDLDGSLSDPQNAELRTLTTATTLTLLRAPNLDGDRKGQVVQFLSQMNLIQGKVEQSLQLQDTANEPLISLKNANLVDAALIQVVLSRANLSYANLRRANLNGAQLVGTNFLYAGLSETNLIAADLRLAFLPGADLTRASLHSANLGGAFLGSTIVHRSNAIAYYSPARLKEADLTGANLGGADLNNVNLSSAILSGAILSGANLNEANLNGANFSPAERVSIPGGATAQYTYATLDGANLTKADLTEVDLSAVGGITQSQLEVAYLCKTRFPQNITLDPDRDCEWLELRRRALSR